MNDDEKENNKNKSNEELDNLIYYNIVFHYHNEPIELMTYYLNNLKFVFDNMFYHEKTQIQICVNFFVSNIDDFTKKLIEHKYISNKIEISIDKYIIIENETNYIETKFYEFTPKNYNFEIRIHEILSKPYKNIFNNYKNILNCYDGNKNKINCSNIKNKINITNTNTNTNIIDGSKSIGFKRYVANIMSWNIYENLKILNGKNVIYNQIKTFLFQIDYGTIIGMHILLHPSISVIYVDGKKENLLEPNNKILSSNEFNYWFETKQFLFENKLTNEYSLDDNNITNDNIETLSSNYDFYHFITTHLLTVIQKFNIVHFTALSITKSSKKIKIIDKKIKINTIPNKPKNYFKEYYKLYKGHYDKFYITDIGLTYLYQNKLSRPITYNKNYTSFSEDLLYTSLLYKLKKLIIPHPFLNTTKCSYKIKKNIIANNSIQLNNKNNELIFIFLPHDDIGNYKIFDIINYVENKKHNVRLMFQDDEITELNKNIKIIKNTYNNLILSNDFYDEKFIDYNNIECNIDNKTNTQLYIQKYSNSKKIFDYYNKNIYLPKINEKNLLIEYKNLTVVFDNNTNFDYYNQLLNNKSNLIVNFYNNNYNFLNDKFKIFQSVKIKKNMNYTNETINFIYDYITNFIDIKKISRKITKNTIDVAVKKIMSLKNLKNLKNKQNEYENKYIKYKSKYLELKKQLNKIKSKI